MLSRYARVSSLVDDVRVLKLNVNKKHLSTKKQFGVRGSKFVYTGANTSRSWNIGSNTMNTTAAAHHHHHCTGTVDTSPPICTAIIRPRRIRPQNIVCRLAARERGGHTGRVGTHMHALREFYTNITPNLSVTNVEKPTGFLRKFSPDGKLLIAFTFDQTALEIYRFRGVSAAGHLTNGWHEDIVPNANSGLAYGIRSMIFHSLFRLQHVVHVTNMGKQLNRECSLFTADNRYVIVGAASFIADDLRPNFYQQYTSNETVAPTVRYVIGGKPKPYNICVRHIPLTLRHYHA